jgi:GlpG protein
LRQIGTLPKALDSKVFADYLLTLGMRARIDEQPEGWMVWIYNEDHVLKARQELQGYVSQPNDPRYQNAIEAARSIRQKDQQLDQEFRKNFRSVADQWAYPSLRQRPLTFGLVAACLVVFLLVESGRFPGLEQQLTFSRTYVDLQGRPRSTGLSDILSGELWRLVSPVFLHFSILHLLFDVWALSAFATLIEVRRGTSRLAVLVFVSAVVSNMGEYLYGERFSPGEPHVFGGISGVVCALFGYIWMKGLYEPEQRMILHPNSVMLMLLWITLCMTGSFTSVIGSIANAAHLAGLVVGVAFGVFRF